ncbi:hypothetical protein AB4453_02285 [Vibrio atlanticus]|uniref:hypothetical protein n=1 Tax=Vibrio TaxID=662 RepID=UPI0014367B1F|nr:hypothetical protein [Vibrio tasmaniensis]
MLIGWEFSIDIGLSSAKKGLALLGAGAVLVSGHPELITASFRQAVFNSVALLAQVLQ